MKTLVRAGLISLLLASAAAAPAALAQATPTPPSAPSASDSVFQATTLSLSAYGEARVAPDMATINLGVLTDGPTAAAALSANAARMNQVIAALKKGGIADRDIQTSNLNVSPQYVYVENQPPKLTGYQVSNQVTVAVHDLKRLGQAVDATVSAGANQVNGISFGLDNPASAENAAREQAVKALMAKADLYARATGHRVVRLVTLSEGGGYSPPPPMPMVAMFKREAAADATPVAAGELRVRVDINGLYELAK